MSNIIDITLFYEAGSLSILSAQEATTLNTIALGKGTYSTHTIYSTTEPLEVNADVYLTINMEGIATCWTDATYAFYRQIYNKGVATFISDMVCSKQGKDIIRIDDWVVYKTEGVQGRIHIPKNPYL